MNKYLLIFIANCFLSLSSLALTLQVLLSSDTHAALDKREKHLILEFERRQRFLQNHPEGLSITLINGDYAGAATFSQFDKGVTGYKILEELAPHVNMVLVMGNHEGLDFDVETFMKQNISFVNNMRKLRPDYGVLAANIRIKSDRTTFLDHKDGDIFRDFLDYESPDGEKVRVIGLVLSDLLQYTNTAAADVFTVEPAIDVAKREIENAARSGIQKVVLATHQNAKPVQAMTHEILEWQSNHPDKNVQNIEILASLAGHGHNVVQLSAQQNERDIPIIESGSEFSHVADIIHSLGQTHVDVLEVATHVGRTKPAELPSYLTAIFENTLRPEIKRVLSYLEEPLGNIIADIPPRAALKVNRQSIGTSISDALSDWSNEFLQEDHGDGIPEVDQLKAQGIELDNHLSMFNSGSFRANSVIKAGVFRILDLVSIFPFDRPGNILILTGQHIKDMIIEHYLFGVSKNTFMTQLPSHIRLWDRQQNKEITQVEKHLSDHPEHIEVLIADKGNWSPIKPNSHYSFALGGWLGQNGFKYESFEKAFLYSAKLTEKSGISKSYQPLPQIMQNHLLPAIKRNVPPLSCTMAIEGEE